MTKKNVLIIEDDEDLVFILCKFIEQNFNNFKVFVANNGPKGLTILESVEIDFLFLDIGVPIIDGRKILQEINFLKKENRPRHIFITTAETQNNLQIISQFRNIYYFAKPIDFKRLKSMLEAILEPKKSVNTKANLDVSFMNPFIESTLQVLEITSNTKAVKEEINITKGQSFKGDISAFYPIHSQLFEGFFCLSFPKQTYLKIMSRMLYTDFNEINEDNRDGVGELCNQIFGNAKAYFNDKFKVNIQMMTPSITIGDSHQIHVALNSPRIMVKFSTDCGCFYVEVSFSKNNQQ